MPQMGTIATLHIPGKQEQQALITGCLRTNGADCKQTSDPNTRYLATEYGQELKLAPGGIYLTAGQAKLCLHFDDQEGVILKSHKEMVLTAKEDIVFEAAERVIFSSPNQIIMATPMGSLVMENELHLHAPKIYVECTDTTKFSQVEAEEKEEGKGGIDLVEMCAKAKGAVATWWDKVDLGEVVVGVIDVIGGSYQAVAGYGIMVASGGIALGAGSTGVGLPVAIGFGAVAIGGFYIGVDGISTATGGVSKIVNGFCGYKKNSKEECKWGFIEEKYTEEGYKGVYLGTQLVIGAISIAAARKAAIGLSTNATAKEQLYLYLSAGFTNIRTGIGTGSDWIGLGKTIREIPLGDAITAAFPPNREPSQILPHYQGPRRSN